MSRTVLITGAGRGIGRELAKRYLSSGATVLVTARDTDDLKDLVADGAEAFRLEVTDAGNIAALKSKLDDRPIDILINNAGVIGKQRTQCLGDLDKDDWIDTLRVNVVAPFAISEALVDNVMASDEKKLIVISSIMGSISSTSATDMIIYRSSKAAVNMVVKCMHNDLSPRGGIVVPLHPGWVSTDMGGSEAPVKPADSARGLVQVIDGLTSEKSGRLFDYQGSEIGW
ncbi:SDR family NAD(P)-dependent oxidoreductase [Minwuia sp.]|uniref:SDR family NAD(P)-dependent oxidoreductase n=1 Tax=Minwuia sp. TaxID=2493630 RepID=UPI003A8D5982